MNEFEYESELPARDVRPGQGRRHALKAFGAAALAAVAGMPLATEAKKNTKKKRKKNRRGKAQVCPECPAEDCTLEAEQAAVARCQAQSGACEILVQSICGDDASCLRERRLCCDDLVKCDTGAFFVCLTAEAT